MKKIVKSQIKLLIMVFLKDHYDYKELEKSGKLTIMKEVKKIEKYVR
jgi:hypothetical protein